MNLEIMAEISAPEIEPASSETFVQHARRVLSARFRQAGLKPGDAEDLTQECLVELITHFDRFDPTKGTIDSWIGGFARNATRAWFRREGTRRNNEVSYLQAPESGLATKEAEIEAEGIRSGLASLCLVDQELLYMRFAMSLSFDEIAEGTGMTSVNARKRVSRAVEKLRKDPQIREALGF
jgi:RNA polymerase sigma-70 factor (ECF subfamily)